MTPVTSMAFRGSPSSVSSFSQPLAGMTRWLAMAWRIRPAPTVEARADEKVAPRSPPRTAGPQAALSIMTV